MRIVPTLKDVARHFDLKEGAIKRWAAKGMPYDCKDGKYSYDLDEITAWKARNIRTIRNKVTDREGQAAVAELRMNTGLSAGEIAKRLDMHENTVKRIVERIDKYRPALEHFKANKADLFAIEQMVYLDHITEEKLEKTSARDLAAMAKMSWEKERVERGESVDNVAVIVKHIRELKQSEDADQG